MKNGDTRFISKLQAGFHKTIAILSQGVGWLFLLGMGGAMMNDRGGTDWSGAIWGLLACLYLIVVGRWAFKRYRDGETTEAGSVRVVRWFNLLNFVFFLAAIAFLVGNLIDPYLYRKLGF